MKKVSKIFRILFLLLTVSHFVFAQNPPVPIEVMIGHEYVYYQHSIARAFRPQSAWGLRHIASLYTHHGPESRPDEIMNQVYLTRKLGKHFSADVGGFYATVPGFKPSLAVQFTLAGKHAVWALRPRADLANRGALEAFTVLEVRPPLSDKLALYTRFQAMYSHGPYHHNRSYQLLRFGLDINGLRFGAGVQFDRYGPSTRIDKNAGVFLQKLL